MIRRFLFCNERLLFRTKDAASGKEIFSGIPPQAPVQVYDKEYWWSDAWDPMQYGRDYDFGRPFFEQMRELMYATPWPSRNVVRIVDSDYSNNAGDLKNCYLCFNAGSGEDSAYLVDIFNQKNCFDVSSTTSSELCYDGMAVRDCYKTFFSVTCEKCTDVWFSRDCIGCSDCFGCVNLRNKKYHIFNEPYTQEAYKEKMVTLNRGSYASLNEDKEHFRDLLLKHPRKYAMISKSQNVSGDDILGAKDCRHCFFVQPGSENCKYSLILIDGAKDIYDSVGAGMKAELVYESNSGVGQNLFFSNQSWGDHHTWYSNVCFDSSYLFGCTGLRDKQYCILNKQYTKEKYEELVPKIIEHMNTMPYTDTRGRVYTYGEFFPPELSPFKYNETIAQEYYPLSKEDALEQGYSWRDPEVREYNVSIKSTDLLDNIKDVQDSVLQETIGCEHEGKCKEQCTTAFRIISQELEFYRKMNLPVPRLCPNCRHYQRLKQRNLLKLWHRKCTCAGARSENGVYSNTITHFHNANHCPNEFETSYAPERPEIVYCEQCYQAEVV